MGKKMVKESSGREKSKPRFFSEANLKKIEGLKISEEQDNRSKSYEKTADEVFGYYRDDYQVSNEEDYFRVTSLDRVSKSREKSRDVIDKVDGTVRKRTSKSRTSKRVSRGKSKKRYAGAIRRITTSEACTA